MSEFPGVELRDAQYRALADPVRRRLLRMLEDSVEPRDIDGLAQVVALHRNTVRGHLDVLHRAGLVDKSSERRASPGRPRTLYARSTRSEIPSTAGYRLLAEMLVTSLQRESDDPSEAAREAGRGWGRYFTDLPPPSQLPSHPEVVTRITAMLRDFGFDPETPSLAPVTTIDLRDCPFRELAREQGQIVCALHLGLLEGSAAALGGSTVIESLEPFVAPSLCRAVLASA